MPGQTGQPRAGEVLRALLGPSRGFCARVVLEAVQQPLLLLGPCCADRDLVEGVLTLPCMGSTSLSGEGSISAPCSGCAS